ncbi:hypothetical protein D0860_07333 [Hortaea werneckii]|uniref:Uncharacterized protein n=1 Tax=Hortaea werneckii TaxID=91943 RepID=A0A3M7GMS0_HORWE|nr:hypothetical protein D0860_07333 [Hortaea werneckii]
MPKPYGQRGRPHDVTTNEHRFRHLHGTAAAAHREGPRNRQPMVDRAWNRDLAAGGGSGQTMSVYDPMVIWLFLWGPEPCSQAAGSSATARWIHPGIEHRLLRNQSERDFINIKWRGHR